MVELEDVLNSYNDGCQECEEQIFEMAKEVADQLGNEFGQAEAFNDHVEMDKVNEKYGVLLVYFEDEEEEVKMLKGVFEKACEKAVKDPSPGA